MTEGEQRVRWSELTVRYLADRRKHDVATMKALPEKERGEIVAELIKELNDE